MGPSAGARHPRQACQAHFDVAIMSRTKAATAAAPLQAQELYDQPEEPVNEAGDVVEPFHLRRELSVGGVPTNHAAEAWEALGRASATCCTSSLPCLAPLPRPVMCTHHHHHNHHRPAGRLL